VLSIVKTFSRFSPPVNECLNFRGGDTVDMLERVARKFGFLAGSVSIKARQVCANPESHASNDLHFREPDTIHPPFSVGPEPKSTWRKF
jgi:hypothetical protein